ncbi:hypothetical protein AMS68_004094 [Peltaster fructicola]|uniref:FAD-binding domain-containing protein n=1 Tax=Peltaster fructicola TaxID=286661 RepID=A0A6H0XUZ2_9PEZI|nr:hypothetical protein AMS68_004094 [Peltaster fructicola]
MSVSQQRKINVAVIGGGMGGLCVAIGLLQHPHVNVQIYEAAQKFAEIGAGVAFGPNAQRALQLISPETEQAYLRQATHHASKETEKIWFEFRFGTPSRDGELITAPRNETGQTTVHRAKFLDEFIRLIPEKLAHFGKRLDRLDDKGIGKGVEMHFQDGTTATADCVIGADGVHSAVRKHLLGADHPALSAKFSGCVAYRGIISMEKATEVLGERYAQTSTIWCGNDGNITTYPIDHGKMLNIAAIGANYKDWEGAWVQNIGVEKLKRDFASWGANAQKIVGLLDNPETLAYSIWDLPSAPAYWRGNVVMMGDAAHASTPFQGQGAGQAIEDAYVLESLFEVISEPTEIPKVFQAYDKVRRSRTQRVVTTSLEAIEIAALRAPGIGADLEALRDNLNWRMDWMWHRDVKGERDEAVMYFEELVAGRDIE